MKKLLIKKIFFLLLAILMTVLIMCTPAFAQEVPFYWDYINVNIDVQTNGDMLVTETQKYVFTSDSTNQRSRYVPLDKVDEIKDVTVQENNKIIPSKTGIKNNQIWINWQHQLKPPEAHIFVINYRVVGGLHINGDNTQVYWKAIFADRKAPIQSAKVQVQLPESLSGKVQNFQSFGIPATSREVNPKTFEFVANHPIPPQRELEVQVTFKSDILNIPQANWQKRDFFDFEKVFSANNIIFMILFAPIVIGIFSEINDRKCPKCKKFTLNRNSKILVAATTNSEGMERVTHHCTNCSYNNEYEKVIPIISATHSSSSSSSRGGGGGGGGGGG
ncbi:DUF2207 domain-containing protein [Cuspidothrix issatschenkoi LEGE 03284]|uniref:DUF2207 domain-containing protein n=1 Tax=Cuspidothrix issatschenkoi TaxID=230752 RepID=UPI00187F00EC|nr:DUF2207 domain-containing protein [Cuspidothrix issatschenkoi]MBE9231279.1 DUF2207 domain-containing protein [Cuspidothrix issatschenkoi LEGE 03284]